MSVDWPHEFPGAYWFDREEEQAVLDVLRNGSPFRYYGLGEPRYVDEFEATAREYYGAAFALAISSGTGALTTALRALDIGPGCEVILPAFMWVASVGAVVQSGAIPVLCEIDDTFCIDPAELEKKITSRTKLILPIHMAGCPCNMDAIMAVAKRHGIAVLEDCAQCNGGEVRGQKVGTFGDIGIFSLQLNKNMTSGEGGLLITADERLYYRTFSAHDMGLIRIDGRLATPEPYAINWGQGRRMSELNGAMAATQIKKLPAILAHMRASKQRIKSMLESIPGIAFRRLNDAAGDTGPFLIVMLGNEKKATKAAENMRRLGLHSVFRIADYGLHIYYNIPALVNKTPLTSVGDPWQLAANAKSVYEYNKGACPKSDALFERSVVIPIPSKLTPQQEADAGDVIKAAVAG